MLLDGHFQICKALYNLIFDACVIFWDGGNLFISWSKGSNNQPQQENTSYTLYTSYHLSDDRNWSHGYKKQDKHLQLGLSPCPVTVTTRTIIFLVGDPYKPSFATGILGILGGGTIQLTTLKIFPKQNHIHPHMVHEEILLILLMEEIRLTSW